MTITNTPLPKQNQNDENNQNKVHPWRLCPAGEHWVREHSMQVPSIFNDQACTLCS
jgi:hypothetical protein